MEAKIDDGVYSVEFEQGYRYITDKVDWVILTKHTSDDPGGVKFMHLTLLDRDTYNKAKTYFEKQQTLEDLADKAAEQGFKDELNKNDWESE